MNRHFFILLLATLTPCFTTWSMVHEGTAIFEVQEKSDGAFSLLVIHYNMQGTDDDPINPEHATARILWLGNEGESNLYWNSNTYYYPDKGITKLAMEGDNFIMNIDYSDGLVMSGKLRRLKSTSKLIFDVKLVPLGPGITLTQIYQPLLFDLQWENKKGTIKTFKNLNLYRNNEPYLQTFKQSPLRTSSPD